MRTLRILIAGGGTAGHINPAIAVARYIRTRQPSAEILFVGAQGGMEEKLVGEAGFPLKTFAMRGFLHKLTPKAIWFNLGTLRRMAASFRAADRILDEFAPDLVFGTGGFACFPPLYRAAKRGIPTAIHESNVKPGQTNKVLARVVDKVLLGFADGEKNFRQKEKLLHTGNPLREGMLFIKKSEAKKKLNMTKPLVYSFWGSLGAREMNKITADLLEIEAKNPKWAHIHSTGSFGFGWMTELMKQKGVDFSESTHLDMREYVFDAPIVMAAADLVLCRAGSMTMSELCATGTPSIIIPSPNVAGKHQHQNARMLSDRGAAIFMEESECTAEKLAALIESLLNDPERLASMRKAALSLAVFDSREKIYDYLMALAKTKK